MKKILVLYNPRSGRIRKERAWNKLRDFLIEPDFTLEHWDLQAQDLHKTPALRSYDLFVVIGGDGTVRHVVQYLMDNAIVAPIAIIPRGSANLVARTLGVPRSIQQTAQMIKNYKTIAMDIAKTSNNYYFIGAFATGYLSRRVLATDEFIKRRVGLLGYFLSFLFELKLQFHQFNFTVDGKQFQHEGHSLFILNTENLLGFNSPHQIDFQDGVFELVVTTNKKFITLIKVFFDFYFKKTPSKHFLIIKGREFNIQTKHLRSLQIDGDSLPHTDPLIITVLPKKQLIIIP